MVLFTRRHVITCQKPCIFLNTTVTVSDHTEILLRLHSVTQALTVCRLSHSLCVKSQNNIPSRIETLITAVFIPLTPSFPLHFKVSPTAENFKGVIPVVVVGLVIYRCGYLHCILHASVNMLILLLNTPDIKMALINNL